MLVLSAALLLATPGCNCGKQDGPTPEDSVASSAGSKRWSGDADVLAAVEQLGDQGAVVVVMRPEAWAPLHAALGPVLSALPSEARPLVEAKDAESLPGLLGLSLGMDPASIELTGWDHERAIVASLGEVPYGGPPGSVTPSLPVRDGWMPPVRHQVLVPTTDAAALIGSLAKLVDAGGKPWPALVEGRDGARAIDLGERNAIALLPQGDAVRVVIFQASGGLGGDARLQHLRGRLDTEPAELERTPALSLLAEPSGVIAGWVRPWRVRPLAAWSGAVEVLRALDAVDADQRALLFSRGMQIVLDAELMMTDAGAELDDLGVSLVADDGVLRLRTASSLTPEGEAILDAGLDGAGDGFVTKTQTEQPWLDAMLRMDLRAALGATEPPPALVGMGVSEMAEAVQEGGYFTTLYMGMRHPLGVVRLFEGNATRVMPVSVETLPTAMQLVWLGMDGDAPRGAMAMQWPKGASTSTFDGLVGLTKTELSLRTHVGQRGGPVTMVGRGVDPQDVFDESAKGETKALAQVRLSLPRLASLAEGEPAAQLLQGDVVMTWARDGKALVSELAWAPSGAEVKPKEVPIRSSGRWDSPMGPSVDEQARACLLGAGRSISQGLRTMSSISPDQIGLVTAKMLAEAEASLGCAAKDDSTAEAAAGLRRMAVELSVDMLDGARQYGSAIELLRTQCEQSKDEWMCARQRELAALPQPTTPEIDWGMECDPDYGLPSGDLSVRMDGTGIAIDGATVTDAELAKVLAARVVEIEARDAAGTNRFEELRRDRDEPGAGPVVRAELNIDASLAMTRVRPLLQALLDAGVTEVVVPVRGTRRPTGALVATLAAKATPEAGAGAGSTGLGGLDDGWALFEVGKGTVTSHSFMRSDPVVHAPPHLWMLRDVRDMAGMAYVYGADDATFADLTAALGGACPGAVLVLAPDLP